MNTKPRPPRFTRDPISPAGTPLWCCPQAERHAWIRQPAPDVDPSDTAALLAHPAWFNGYEIDELDGFSPQTGGTQNYRLYYRDRGGHLWCVIERCETYADAVERGFIIACVTRAIVR